MEDFIKINVCGRVAGYDFVRSCIDERFSYINDRDLKSLRQDYKHLLVCEHCLEGVVGALEEFALGNSQFNTMAFHTNVTYLQTGR